MLTEVLGWDDLTLSLSGSSLIQIDFAAALGVDKVSSDQQMFFISETRCDSGPKIIQNLTFNHLHKHTGPYIHTSKTLMPLVPDMELQEVAVVCDSNLGEGIECGQFGGIESLAQNCRDERSKPTRVIKVLYKDGKLAPHQNSEIISSDLENWMTYIRPSRGRHEQNLEAVFDPIKGHIYLRTTRSIGQGEELLLWYSDELARFCGLPILTPTNIRGNQLYICTMCNVCFKFPNPLKSHIRFHCSTGRTNHPLISSHVSSISTTPASPARGKYQLSEIYSPIKVSANHLQVLPRFSLNSNPSIPVLPGNYRKIPNLSYQNERSNVSANGNFIGNISGSPDWKLRCQEIPPEDGGVIRVANFEPNLSSLSSDQPFTDAISDTVIKRLFNNKSGIQKRKRSVDDILQQNRMEQRQWKSQASSPTSKTESISPKFDHFSLSSVNFDSSLRRNHEFNNVSNKFVFNSEISSRLSYSQSQSSPGSWNSQCSVKSCRGSVKHYEAISDDEIIEDDENGKMLKQNRANSLNNSSNTSTEYVSFHDVGCNEKQRNDLILKETRNVEISQGLRGKTRPASLCENNSADKIAGSYDGTSNRSSLSESDTRMFSTNNITNTKNVFNTRKFELQDNQIGPIFHHVSENASTRSTDSVTNIKVTQISSNSDQNCSFKVITNNSRKSEIPRKVKDVMSIDNLLSKDDSKESDLVSNPSKAIKTETPILSMNGSNGSCSSRLDCSEIRLNSQFNGSNLDRSDRNKIIIERKMEDQALPERGELIRPPNMFYGEYINENSSEVFQQFCIEKESYGSVSESRKFDGLSPAIQRNLLSAYAAAKQSAHPAGPVFVTNSDYRNFMMHYDEYVKSVAEQQRLLLGQQQQQRLPGWSQLLGNQNFLKDRAFHRHTEYSALPNGSPSKPRQPTANLSLYNENRDLPINSKVWPIRNNSEADRFFHNYQSKYPNFINSASFDRFRNDLEKAAEDIDKKNLRDSEEQFLYALGQVQATDENKSDITKQFYKNRFQRPAVMSKLRVNDVEQDWAKLQRLENSHVYMYNDPAAHQELDSISLPNKMERLYKNQNSYLDPEMSELKPCDEELNQFVTEGENCLIKRKSSSLNISDPDELANGVAPLLSCDGKANKRYMCLYCGKLYSRKYGLKIHVRTHTGFKPLKCRVCFRPFGDPSNLNKHIRLHAEGDTPYRCPHCGKVLVRRRDLERHIRSRHPDALPTLEASGLVNADQNKMAWMKKEPMKSFVTNEQDDAQETVTSSCFVSDADESGLIDVEMSDL